MKLKFKSCGTRNNLDATHHKVWYARFGFTTPCFLGGELVTNITEKSLETYKLNTKMAPKEESMLRGQLSVEARLGLDNTNSSLTALSSPKCSLLVDHAVRASGCSCWKYVLRVTPCSLVSCPACGRACLCCQRLAEGYL